MNISSGASHDPIYEFICKKEKKGGAEEARQCYNGCTLSFVD